MAAPALARAQVSETPRIGPFADALQISTTMDDNSRAVFASRPVEFNPFTELNLTTDPRQAERIDDIDVQSALRRLSLAGRPDKGGSPQGFHNLDQ